MQISASLMNIQKINLNCLRALLVLLTLCLPPGVIDNAEQFKVGGLPKIY